MEPLVDYSFRVEPVSNLTALETKERCGLIKMSRCLKAPESLSLTQRLCVGFLELHWGFLFHALPS